MPIPGQTCGKEKQRWSVRLLVPEMRASVAIAVMWLSVLFTAIYGRDIVTSTVGGDNSTIPSMIVVAFFAFFGTWVAARYGYRRIPID
jgi:ABC-type dipeptide/oligopeptide/nickel transport system permease subunit